MGALAPLSSWIPADDLLLKNAVEAGASLESLAKGAVQFSRKFTVRELQERWHSLLYDPVISAEASFHMIEFERSAATLPSKLSGAGNSRENKYVYGKRKVESVRNFYYALRKRIRNEPFDPMNLTFLIAPTDGNYMGNDHCSLGDPVSDQIQESNMHIMHYGFPETGDDINVNSFDVKFQNTVPEDYPLEPDNVNTEMPQVCGEHISPAANETLIEEYGGPEELPVNVDQVNGFSKFDGEHDLSSPIIGCDVSFHNLDYSSPLPEMPIWRTVEGVSLPSIPLNMPSGDTYSLPNDCDTKNTCLSEFHMSGDASLELEIPNEDMKTVTGSTEVYLAELSSSLLNFTNEEELLFTDDGKDTIDKSYYDGLSSLLLSSPVDANQDHMADVTQPGVNLDYPKDQASGSHEVRDQDEGPHRNNDIVVNTEDQQHLTIASTSNVQLHEMNVDVMTCTLNTEDPEIPCNDDFIITNHLRPKPFASVGRRNIHDVPELNPSTVKDFSGSLNTNGRVLTLTQKEQELPAPSHVHSHTIRSQVIQETGSLHPVDDSRIKIDLPSSCAHRSMGNASKAPSEEAIVPITLKEETPEVVALKHFSNNVIDCSMQNPAVGLDGQKCSHLNAGDVKQVLGSPPQSQQYQTSYAKVGSVNIAPSDHIDQLSDEEEPPIESDDDVPYFSDIEAMILDMDLDPEDQDLYSSEEVSRYQQEDTKRVIVRLEQGAHSYMQRAIASQGAFAILYGRHSKHYIKKPEVLLGRGTEDVTVDIDLWREERGNKVSRRQAIINLDKSGSFYLRNFGKCPISVNDKEIARGQSLSLPSSCLIEIRGMPFIFETNQTRVKQYLDSLTQQNQTLEQHF